MKTQTDYFKEVAYKSIYQIGDRVRGFWNNVPFTGSVAVDTLIDSDDGPYVMVFLDLPIKYENSIHTIVKVKHENFIDIKGKYDINCKTSNKK